MYDTRGSDEVAYGCRTGSNIAGQSLAQAQCRSSSDKTFIRWAAQPWMKTAGSVRRSSRAAILKPLCSHLTVRQSRSTEMLSKAQPRPPTVIRTLAAFKMEVKATAVNLTPCSVLKISRRPCCKACRRANWQKRPSKVLDNCHAST